MANKHWTQEHIPDWIITLFVGLVGLLFIIFIYVLNRIQLPQDVPFVIEVGAIYFWVKALVQDIVRLKDNKEVQYPAQFYIRAFLAWAFVVIISTFGFIRLMNPFVASILFLIADVGSDIILMHFEKRIRALDTKHYEELASSVLVDFYKAQYMLFCTMGVFGLAYLLMQLF